MDAKNPYYLECPRPLTYSDRAPWPRRSSHPTASRHNRNGSESLTINDKGEQTRENYWQAGTRIRGSQSTPTRPWSPTLTRSATAKSSISNLTTGHGPASAPTSAAAVKGAGAGELASNRNLRLRRGCAWTWHKGRVSPTGEGQAAMAAAAARGMWTGKWRWTRVAGDRRGAAAEGGGEA
jgi:hypothetical protein